MARSYVTNPLTGRLIQIGGTVFNQLVFEAYDFINGELVRRDSASPIPNREYYYNILTRRRILANSRRYHELINDGWDIHDDYYLYSLGMIGEVLGETRYGPREYSLPPPTTFEQIMNRHRNTLNNLNITLCKECFLPIKIEEGEYCNECQPE